MTCYKTLYNNRKEEDITKRVLPFQQNLYIFNIIRLMLLIVQELCENGAGVLGVNNIEPLNMMPDSAERATWQ